jgi:hypothetical protein
MRVGRKKIGRLDEAVGKIAAPAAGYKDFFADLVAALENEHTPATLTRGHGTHQAGSTATNHNDIKKGQQRLLSAKTGGSGQGRHDERDVRALAVRHRQNHKPSVFLFKSS